ncbi:MAG: 4-vinyl reductase [Candidatus Micrarchaeia archaeon]
MVSIIDRFRIANLVKFGDGDINLMGLPVCMIPICMLVEIQKTLIKDLGYEKAYEKLYESAKYSSKQYNDRFIVKYGLKDRRKLLEWQTNIVTCAGWGRLEISKIDFENKEWRVHIIEGPFAREYGKAPYPVDIITTGFIAGGLCSTLDFDVDAIETNCVAMGDSYCNVLVAEPDKIAEMRAKRGDK